jgi:hypothetical protein
VSHVCSKKEYVSHEDRYKINVFFLKHARELHIISLIEEKMYKGTSKMVDYKTPIKSTKYKINVIFV